MIKRINNVLSAFYFACVTLLGPVTNNTNMQQYSDIGYIEQSQPASDLGKPQKKSFFSGPATKRGGGG